MQLKKNPVKQALREGRTVFGLYIAVPEPTMVELAGQAGFDFIRIDISHNAYDLPTVVHMIRAAEAVGVTPMARVDNDPYLIANVLEAGMMGLIVPDVATYEKAVSVVKAVHFAPLGDRGTYSAARVMGYGRVSGGDYSKWSNEEILLGIQIESKEDLRKHSRLGRSTDYGDAVVMAFWQEKSSTALPPQPGRLPLGRMR